MGSNFLAFAGRILKPRHSLIGFTPGSRDNPLPLPRSARVVKLLTTASGFPTDPWGAKLLVDSVEIKSSRVLTI